MLIEIKGAGFVNKGSELMLHAVLQAIRPHISGAVFTMAPRYGIPSYDRRAGLGLLQKFSFSKHGIQWDFLGKLIPERMREMYGLVLDDDVDVVLDVSGYAYGDPFGDHKTILMAKQSGKWKKKGKKVILLPQAMGPFSSHRIKDALKRLVESASLVFARDRTSYAYVADLVGSAAHVKISPDFTNLLPGIVPEYYSETKHRVCIIPSHQMTDKTSKAERESYVPFLVGCINHLIERKIVPFMLIHGGDKDLPLAQQVQNAAAHKIESVTEPDPLRIKGLLGKCDLVIASRFHALVSALSQGTICIGAGWSHKYEALFEDYNCPELLILDNKAGKKMEDTIDEVLDPNMRAKLQQRVCVASEFQRQLSLQMWTDVLRTIRPDSQLSCESGEL